MYRPMSRMFFLYSAVIFGGLAYFIVIGLTHH
jgi:hypothetical protein